MNYLPVIIIGAGRSGTNMLRDILTQLPGVGTWPCDEINYIWRHGNVHEPTDEFAPDLATDSVRRSIRRAFDRLAVNHGLTHVIEKTCANSLRVGFVDRILPDARFVHLVRDGHDVALSAAKRWTAPLDLQYVLRKARYVPVLDLPYYATRYLWSRAHRLFSHEQRLASWGPRFEGMSAAHREHSLIEVCGLQWQRCVERSDEALAQIDASRVYRLCYEDLVARPADKVLSLANFLDVTIAPQRVGQLVSDVSSQSVGNARKCLDAATMTALEDLLANTLRKHGYGLQDRNAGNAA